MIILGIDPGIRNCGFVVTKDRIPIMFDGFFTLSASNGHHRRAYRIVRSLQAISIAYKVDAVAMEAYYGRGSKKGHKLSAANYSRGVLDGMLNHALGHLPIYSINPIHLKQWVTGNHKAKKEHMVEACRTLAVKACPWLIQCLDSHYGTRQQEHILEAWAIATIGHCLHNKQYTRLNYLPDKKALLKRIETSKPKTNPRFFEPPQLPLTIMDHRNPTIYDELGQLGEDDEENDYS